ncbi:MAG: hypothetical protein COB54_00165 [Alphaproteobacteria bacterium]|nr:MAG: hypothetical protein COB54_00165 [Alphaproteobacteria bacterium]
MKASFLTRKWHKWLFLVIGVQMVLWAVGGFYMVTISIDYIHGDHLIKSIKPNAPGQSAYTLPLREVMNKYPTATQIETGTLLDKAVYKITTPNGNHLVDAGSGRALSPLPEATIKSIAQNLYAGPGPISSIRLLTENPPSEIQTRPLPLWQVNFDDTFSPTLYFSPVTGKLISKRQDTWRLFDIMWMLHIMDYEDRSDVNNWLLRIAATVVSLSALAGIWLLFYSFNGAKKKTLAANSPALAPSPSTSTSWSKAFFRTLHKWLGLIIGLQVAIWCLTGLSFSILPHDTVQGSDLARHHAPQPITSGSNHSTVINIADLDGIESFNNLALRIQQGRLVYQVSDQDGTRLIDATLGQPVSVDEKMSRKIALDDYSGAAVILSAETVMMPTSDMPRSTGPAWKIDFDDGRQTALYISVETGQILARRNDIWRVFDFFIMLHFMDYPGNNNFNNPWIIFTAFAALWLAISGIILLFQSFTRTEFKAAWHRITGRKSRLKLTVLDIHGGLDNSLTTRFGTPLYTSLAEGGILLPSSCGGGGTCGLCRVKFVNNQVPIMTADRAHFTKRELDAGYRLSCQHRQTEDTAVELPDDVLSQEPIQAEVISNRPLTPSIHEITLKVAAGNMAPYQAGSYMLVEIPTEGASPLSRAYSLATPSAENPDEIVLNIRNIPAPADQPNIPAGLGSSYMCGLEIGAEVTLSGPFGHFSANNSDREMVFIGGGAGMAPLRAIIRDQLLHKKSGRKISFWYGVRNKQDIFYQEEFTALVDNHENMSFQIGLSETQDGDDWQGPVGFIHQITLEHYLSDHPDLSSTEFYLCGPPAMLAATRGMLQDLGIDETNISFDDFGI